jgi:hypothetical protein
LLRGVKNNIRAALLQFWYLVIPYIPLVVAIASYDKGLAYEEEE